MIIDNHKRDKKAWLKKEKRIRVIIIGIIIAILFLVVVLIFFQKQIWAIITVVAVIVGLIVDLYTLLNIKKGR